MDLSADTEQLETPLMADTSQELREENETQAKWHRNLPQLTAMLSNFSTSYNVVNISLVLPIVKTLKDGSEEAISSCASSLLAGMMVGQVLGGALGDIVGRLQALRLVMLLQIVASLGSSLIGINYVALAIWRFVLGISAGGVYPLAACLSSESAEREQSSSQEEENNQSHSPHQTNPVHNVVLTFSTQGLGFVTVPIVAVILFHMTEDLNLIWRLLLGFGCIPGIFLMLLQYSLYERGRQSPVYVSVTEDEDQDGDEDPDEVHDEEQVVVNEQLPQDEGVLEIEATENNATWFQSLFHEPGLLKKIIGTAGTWFFFDVIFYGNTIFQPIVVEAAFGQSEAKSEFQELSDTARKSLILTSIALPGYFIAAMLIGKRLFCITQTPRYVMMQGFAAMGLLYLLIGIKWSYLRQFPALLIFLYGMTFFFANYGPNTTTFILPSLLYSPEHRTTWNGISAACGKLGALLGASLFEPAADDLGDNTVMLICGGLSVFAFFLTSCFVPKTQ